MIHKLLIANRGEVAARVIRTAKHMGIGTVAVHSEADARALHVLEADETVHIGPAPPRDSYLKIEQIVSAARDIGADAVHPGYGFLSESVAFARACRDAGLVFVGPSNVVIAAMADKVVSRANARAAGIPVIPASKILADVDAAKAAAAQIGYPVLLKPASGGSGLGQQRADDPRELAWKFEIAQDEADTFFDDQAVYVERYLDRPRHVEVQLAADHRGNLIHLGQRDSTVQRRSQTVLEEAPCPNLKPELCERITAAAVALGRYLEYDSLGTVEMLVCGEVFYFLELNARLPPGHAVTEMVTGLDLVEWQIRIALDEELPATQEEIELEGHAIGCRILAEDPTRGFEPSPGRIERFVVPTGPWVRNDVGVAEGEYITPHYDPQIAKLVVHGPDRESAIFRMAEALAGYDVRGVTTNVDMHRRMVESAAYATGEVSTRSLREMLGLPA